jgi:lipopolysaccharide biosynthesis glycosyltransferase
MHVCYCLNRKMLEPLCVSAYSAAVNMEREGLTIWVFQTDFSPQDIDRLQRHLNPFPGVTLKVQSVDMDVFGGIKGLHGEVVPFAKLLLPRWMEGRADRIIYLDADTVVAGGLRDLYERNLEGHTLGAVSYEPFRRTLEVDFYRARGLDLERDSFNSGVMLIDIEKWNAGAKTEQLIEQVRDVDPREAEGDQPFLNATFYDDFLSLRIRYNKRAGPSERLEKKHTTDGILHFVGIPKPWNIGGRWFNENYHLYEKHRRRAGVPARSLWKVVQDEGGRRVLKGLLAGVRGTIR